MPIVGASHELCALAMKQNSKKKTLDFGQNKSYYLVSWNAVPNDLVDTQTR